MDRPPAGTPAPDVAGLDTNNSASQAALVAALEDPRCYPHPAPMVERRETHVSHVLLAGDYAYKIKKPLNLGFLDFSTLARRRHFCEEELRLNRRLAPNLYQAVVPIRMGPTGPRIGNVVEQGPGPGEGQGGGQGQPSSSGVPATVDDRDAVGEPVVEYAVRMARFPQEALLDGRLARGQLGPGEIDAVADQVAAFHGRIARAVAGPYGTPAQVWAPMAQNFEQLREWLPGPAMAERLTALADWSQARAVSLAGFLEERLAGGWVRECHGDLHLGNIAWLEDGAVLFDGLEFNPGLRWIDVISEIAFLVMDLTERGRPDYARRCLNRYLEGTGDYAGLALLAYYQAYRALVRAKVAALRATQEAPAEGGRELAEAERYLAHAEALAAPGTPRLILLHGLSGSGKSWLGQGLVERLGAIRIRSDVERKRLHGLAPRAASASTVGGGLYGNQASVATYERLADLARVVLAAGYPVVVDAASLRRWQRERFQRLGQVLGAPFILLDCQAPEGLLRERLARRQAAGDDASEADGAVLTHQLSTREPLAPEEQARSLSVDTTGAFPEDLVGRILAG